MNKIIFVCTGNTCRSVMAEGIFNNMILQKKLDKKYVATSCGISALDGENASIEASFVLKDNFNVDISNHKAQNIRNIDFEKYNLIFCMTKYQKMILDSLFPKYSDKIFTLKSFVGLKGDIVDPFGSGIDVYSKCAFEIMECIDLLFKKEDF